MINTVWHYTTYMMSTANYKNYNNANYKNTGAIPKDFKKSYLQLPCSALSIKKNSVENKPACLLVVFLGKALNKTPPPLCDRQVAYPYFMGLQL